MSDRRFRILVVTSALFAIAFMESRASAQSLGVFRWQLQPYCNVLTVTVTQVGGTYRLEGTDDHCGASTQGEIIGTAFPNPNGTIGLGFDVVSTPGGASLPVEATVTLPSASGTWRDGGGLSGTFALTPGAGNGGARRPTTPPVPTIFERGDPSNTGVGAAALTIPNGTLDNTAVGYRTLATASGDGNTAIGAHTLELASTGIKNTALGALAGGNTTTGSNLVAIGYDALRRNATGSRNVAVGAGSQFTATAGQDNVGVGFESLFANVGSFNTALGSNAMRQAANASGNVAIGFEALFQTRASNNVAIGRGSLRSVVSGFENVAVGWRALEGATGVGNTAIGSTAGSGLVNGSNNLYLGAPGVNNDDGQIRIGTSGTHTGVVIQGIYNQVASGGTTVYVNPLGRLGTLSSSRRFKENVSTVSDAARVIQALRPVRFRYKPEVDDGSRTPQYGLIAEEVAEVEPELAAFAADGTIDGVRYQFLAPLLVAEAQRLEQARAALQATVDQQAAEMKELRDTVRTLTATVAAVAAPRR